MKIFRFLPIVFYIFIGMFSCKTPDEHNRELAYDLQVVTIPITDHQLNSYQVYHAYHEHNINKIIGYNETRHSLNFFDMDEGEVIKDIELESEGPNALKQISSIYYHNEDSFFLYERGVLHIVNSEGILINTYNLYELFNVLQEGEPVLNFYFKLNYNSSSKKILFFLNTPRQGDPTKLPLMGSLNIMSGQVEIFPIYHSEFFKSVEGSVGFLTYLGFYEEFNGKIPYNFQYESTLFLYDRSNSEIISSAGTKNQKLISIQKLTNSDAPEVYDQHALENTHFLTIIPDKWQNLLYRINWGAPIESFPNAGFTEKKQSISVFDENLNFLHEFFLPDHTYQINNWFVNDKGLYLNFAHPMNENQKEDFLIFHIFKVNKNN